MGTGAGHAAGAALALALLAAAGPAVAQERPVIRPTRDVDVTYRVPSPAGDLQERMRWLVSQDLLRVDPPGGGMFMIVNYARHQIWLVQDATRRYRELDAKGTALPGSVPEGSFTRQGADTVAGVPCTQWRTRDSAGRPVLICLTADGVLLRAATAGPEPRTLLEAVRVAYGRPDAAAFRVPDGYTPVEPPAPGR